MCGIALIISSIRLDLSPLITSSNNPSSQFRQPLFSIADIKAALRRRGPDSLASKRIFLKSIKDDLCILEGEVEIENDLQDYDQTDSEAELCFIGATLQLRGTSPIVQPLVDASGNILVYNGEIFGGIYVGSDSNDGEVLMESLGKCCSLEDIRACNGCGMKQNSVPDVLSTIKGPWALIYWQVECPVPRLCGSVETLLEGGASLFIGQARRTLGFCYLLCHLLAANIRVLGNVKGVK